MNYKEYENKINRDFQGFENSIDDTGMWEHIEPHLPKKKRRSPIWIFSLLMMSMALFSLVTWAYYYDSESEHIDTAEIVHNDLERSNNNGIVSEQYSVPDDHSFNDQRPEEGIYQSSKSGVIVRDKSQSNNDIKVERPTFYQTDISVPSRTLLELQEHRKPNTTFIDYREARLIQTAPIQLNWPQLIEEDVKLEAASVTTISGSVDERIGLQKLNIQLLPNDLEIPLMDYVFAKNRKDGEGKRVFIALETGIGYALLNPNYSTSNPEFRELIESRRNLEKTLESISLYSNFKMSLSRSFSLSLGIEFYRFRTSSVTTRSTDTIEEIPGVVSIFNRSGGTIEEEGAIQVLNQTEQTWQRFNTSTNLAIPLQLFYRRHIGSFNSLQIGVGYRKGILNRTRGYEEDLVTGEYSLTTDDENRLRITGQDHAMISASWLFHLRTGQDLSIGLRYLHDMTGIYNSNIEIQKKLHHIGLQTSIQLPINK